ncbi:hypothetical protein AcW1_009000 [Taiwanofungus camphoratus]|nr:hypothetical protein AcW1_009000 [Antrodia cinnamomea]
MHNYSQATDPKSDLGSMYFVSLLLLNVLDMILWLTSVFEEFVQFFILPISSILISRCLLNLREVVNVPVECATMGHPSFVRSGIQASHTSPPSVKFASDTLGNTSIGDAQEFPSISTHDAWDGPDAGLSVIESNNDTEMAKPEC